MYGKLTYLVGHSRGGTTWFAELLSLHPDIRYIFEPFASQAHPYTGIDTQHLFNNNRYYVPQKQGSRRLEFPVEQFFNMSEDSQYLDRYRGLALDHLRQLACLAFPNQSGYHLVIKQPRLENLGWAVTTLRPEHTVMIDRHPFGVLNSIARGGYWGWVETEWKLAQASVPAAYPHFADCVAGADTLTKQSVALSHLRSLVARDYCGRNNMPVVEYEQLCLTTEQEMRRVCAALRLEWSGEYQAAIERKLGDTAGGPDMLDTRRNAVERAHAWRIELPIAQQNELTRFIVRYGLAIAYPGGGLAALTASEVRANATAARIFKRQERARNRKMLLKLLGARIFDTER